jgi:hypothetical protein
MRLGCQRCVADAFPYLPKTNEAPLTARSRDRASGYANVHVSASAVELTGSLSARPMQRTEVDSHADTEVVYRRPGRAARTARRRRDVLGSRRRRKERIDGGVDRSFTRGA